MEFEQAAPRQGADVVIGFIARYKDHARRIMRCVWMRDAELVLRNASFFEPTGVFSDRYVWGYPCAAAQEFAAAAIALALARDHPPEYINTAAPLFAPQIASDLFFGCNPNLDQWWPTSAIRAAVDHQMSLRGDEFVEKMELLAAKSGQRKDQSMRKGKGAEAKRRAQKIKEPDVDLRDPRAYNDAKDKDSKFLCLQKNHPEIGDYVAYQTQRGMPYVYIARALGVPVRFVNDLVHRMRKADRLPHRGKAHAADVKAYQDEIIALEDYRYDNGIPFYCEKQARDVHRRRARQEEATESVAEEPEPPAEEPEAAPEPAPSTPPAEPAEEPAMDRTTLVNGSICHVDTPPWKDPKRAVELLGDLLEVAQIMLDDLPPERQNDALSLLAKVETFKQQMDEGAKREALRGLSREELERLLLARL